MPRPRLRILAIAPDPEEREELRSQLSKRFAIDSVDAVSPEDSDQAFRVAVPALVLMSALTAPSAEEHVMRQLEQVDPDGFVPVLTVPPFVAPGGATAKASASFRKRARARIGPDPELVLARIGETLVRLRDEASRPSTRPAKRIAQPADVREDIDRPDSNATTALVRIPTPVRTPSSFARTQSARAARLTPDELPQALSLSTGNGVIVRLLNLSTTGLLFESPFKFIPGTETSLNLIGPERNTTLPSRFVRSEVSAVEARGVTYRTAVRFNREVDVVAPPPAHDAQVASGAARMRAVADLLARVTSCHSAHGDYAGARAAFEAGMRKVLPACEVTLRDSLVKPSAGRESVYFTIPSRWGAVMQATFRADHALTAEEFSLLEMAAAAAAVILQFETTAADRHRRGQVA